VISRGQLRDHPAVEPMQLDLAEQLVRQEAAVAIQDRGGTLIA
jgi:hypothetical protein